jgi:ABC-type phosphate transport system substrate-binding protein
MNNVHSQRYSVSNTILVILALALGGIPAALAAPPSGFVLVVNASSVTETSLSNQQARQVLSGMSTTWSNGKPVNIVLPPRGSAASKWLEAVIGMPEVTHRRFLLGQVFRGTARKPAEPADTDALRAALERTPGAVGVVPAGAVSPALRVVAILP